MPEQIENNQEAYWELQKFLIMALKANRNLGIANYEVRMSNA